MLDTLSKHSMVTNLLPSREEASSRLTYSTSSRQAQTRRSPCMKKTLNVQRSTSNIQLGHPRKTSILRRPGPCCIMLSMSSVVSQDPEILGGEPVFTGTRVPVKSLFDHLQAGDSIEQFFKGFPSVKREQVIALLEEAREYALSAS